MNYYADSIVGSDSNPGTSQAKPWRTLAPVHAQNFLPGDVVSFRRGSSWTGGLTIDRPGVEGNPITFTAYGVGDRPVFANPGGHAVTIDWGVSWVIAGQFLARDAKYYGVRIRQEAHHNIVRDVEATDVGTGVAVWGEHNLVTRNYVHDLNMIRNTPAPDDDYGAEGVKLYGPNNEVSYNRLIDCIADSHDYGKDGGGIALLATVDGAYVHHNWVENSKGFLEVGMGSAKNVVVAYNVSVNNGRFSWIHLSGPCAGVVENFRVENNTIVETGDNPHWVIFGFRGAPGADTFIARNNVLYVDQHTKIANASGFTHDHNLYCLRGSTQLGFTLGQGEEIADPLFVDLDRRDFRLQPESPARGAGVWLSHAFDFDDKPVTNPPDLGAYQYQEAEMTIVEMLRLKATEMRAMAVELDLAADTLAAIDVTAEAAVIETEEALAATQAVAEAL